MRVTTKGQVTIPKQIRAQLGIKPGTEVEFRDCGDGEVTLVPCTTKTASAERTSRDFMAHLRTGWRERSTWAG